MRIPKTYLQKFRSSGYWAGPRLPIDLIGLPILSPLHTCPSDFDVNGSLYLGKECFNKLHTFLVCFVPLLQGEFHRKLRQSHRNNLIIWN